MKILIAGGAGFLGSNLTGLLLQKNHQVLVVDNLITGRKQNLNEFKTNSNFSFLQADVSEKKFLNHPKILNEQFDLIYHLASPASPPKYQKYQLETLHANSLGTENLLELSKDNKATFVYASTSEVYGNPLEHPQTEKYWGNVNSFGERSCYDESKRYGEAVCFTYLHKFKVNLRIARIFNTYGPKMDPEDGRVVTNLLHQAIKNEPLTIYGDGSQTRSFCYVDDLISGLYLLGTVKEAKGDIINLGNPAEFTVLETAKLIKKLTNSKSKFIYKDMPSDDPAKRQPNISKAKKILNWEPKINFETGLKKMLATKEN